MRTVAVSDPKKLACTGSRFENSVWNVSAKPSTKHPRTAAAGATAELAAAGLDGQYRAMWSAELQWKHLPPFMDSRLGP